MYAILSLLFSSLFCSVLPGIKVSRLSIERERIYRLNEVLRWWWSADRQCWEQQLASRRAQLREEYNQCNFVLSFIHILPVLSSCQQLQCRGQSLQRNFAYLPGHSHFLSLSEVKEESFSCSSFIDSLLTTSRPARTLH